MSEYDWEQRRVARTIHPDLQLLGVYRPRPSEVAEFVALEHPRESVGWVLHQHAQAQARERRSSPSRPRTGKPVVPAPITPLDLQE